MQAAVGSLREASLCVVELVQAWRRARRGHLQSDNQEARSSTPAVSWGVSSDLETTPTNGSPDKPEQSCASSGREKTADGRSLEVRFPDVPTARPVSSFDEDLPTFWWLPPGKSWRENGTSLSPESSVPEQVGHDLNEDDSTPSSATLKRHRHSESSTTAKQGTDSNSSGKAFAENNPLSAHEASGVNYLARMATDTDFVGAPGSVLADFFPPDTKLHRNPFVLGHNLDDTLAVFTGGGGVSPRDRGHEDRGGSSSTALRKSRLDTRRIRVASEIIVAEDIRERSSKRSKRRRAEEGREQEVLPGDAAGEGNGVPARDGAAGDGHEESATSPRAHGQQLDRQGSGGSTVGRDGSANSSKKRKGKGGITFQDIQGEGILH